MSNNQYLGETHIHLECVNSTNDYIKTNCLSYPEGTVVTADTQTSGKGRLGRIWESGDSGSLYMSVLLKPDVKSVFLPLITLMCGLAVCNALKELGIPNCKIKWPNDIVCDNKKLCGILCESTITNGKIHIISGIGINLNNAEFPPAIAEKACSLYSVTGKTFDKSKVMSSVLSHLQILYDEYKKCPTFFLDEYKEHCISLNRQVSFNKNDRNITAIATDIDNTGSLICLLNGKSYAVSSGEVTVQGIY